MWLKKLVAKRLRELPGYHEAMTHKDHTSDKEEQPVPRRKKGLKSGMHRTWATTVVRKVTWPYGVVYFSADKPASYQDISIPPFVQGYMIIMESEDSTIRHRMAAHLKNVDVRC